MQRLVALLLLLTSFAAKAQMVQVEDAYGFVDATTKRVLVAATDASQLPAVTTVDGTDYDVVATTLPLVRLEHGEVDSDTFCPGSLTLIDPQTTSGSAVEEYSAEFRYRGATALHYDKKNYAVRLSTDASLLGMRNDNSWILDAMASDCSRMRNRVSTDLWLDFSRRPYYADEEPTMTNGTHGRFVELFLGDRYWGLYCLTEKVDRKQLCVKKYKDGAPRGIIYKSYDYANFNGITDPDPSNDSYTWQGWEASYPDVRKGEPFDWMPLYRLYEFLAQEVPSFNLIDHLHQRIDLPVWRDYIIFCDLLHADDNVAKNMIVYFRDLSEPVTFVTEKGKVETVPSPGPLGICPWDLDATWGRTFKREPIAPTDNCNVSNFINYHIWVSQLDNGESYYKRWAELRESVFTPDNLWKYFERYFDLFDASGARDREVERWQDVNGVHIDFDAERSYVRRWIADRLYYLDGDYEYVDESIAHITPDAPASTSVYTLDGRHLSDVPTTQGVYIVNGKKKIVK